MEGFGHRGDNELADQSAADWDAAAVEAARRIRENSQRGDPEFDALLAEHAANVEASCLAWSTLQAAQAESHRLREAEHKTAEMLKVFLSQRLKALVKIGHPQFKPVPIGVEA